MTHLTPVRRATAYDPHILTREPLFWALARAVRALGPYDDFPPVDALGAVFDADRGEPPVRFVVAPPRRRRREAIEPCALYDARITLEGVVPTRERSWHDLMNALVWGTFPQAKRALHARQHRAIAARLSPGHRRLPPSRTRELDALALLDEGGVVIASRDPSATRAALGAAGDGSLGQQVATGAVEVVVFGHAIYESLALGVAPAVVAAIVVGRGDDGGTRGVVDTADEALAELIKDDAALMNPAELKRVDLNEAARRG